jgi:eukaryotic-like serine/threonine-protein kinase
MSAPTYWAFLSYSHADEKWAKWLHRALERYRVPARLVGRATPGGTVPSRIRPCFRDQAELAAAAHLGESLQKALAASRALVVICSPRSAASRWVNQEIEYFRALDRGGRILALVVDGDPAATEGPEACFPPALLRDAAGQPLPEPLAADVRPGRDGKGDAFLKVAAGLLDVGFDELRSREQARRIRVLAVGIAASLLMATAMAGMAWTAYQARNEALRSRQQAEDLLQFMLGDLRDKLRPIGRLEVLDAVGAKALDYFSHFGSREPSARALGSRATALRQIGELRALRGDLPEALVAYEEALKLDRERAARHPDDPDVLASLAASQSVLGEGHLQLGDAAQAEPSLQAAMATLGRLRVLQPDEPRWIHRSAEIRHNLAAAAYVRGDVQAAVAGFEAAVAQHEQLPRPLTPEQLTTLAESLGWLAYAETQRSNGPRARQHALAETRIYREMLRREPDSAVAQFNLASAQTRLLAAMVRLQGPGGEPETLAELLVLSERLVRNDPDNVNYAKLRIGALRHSANSHLHAGRQERAQRDRQRALELARATFRRDALAWEPATQWLGTLVEAIEIALLRGDRPRARALIDEARATALTDEQRDRCAPQLLELDALERRLAKGGAASG